MEILFIEMGLLVTIITLSKLFIQLFLIEIIFCKIKKNSKVFLYWKIKTLIYINELREKAYMSIQNVTIAVGGVLWSHIAFQSAYCDFNVKYG